MKKTKYIFLSVVVAIMCETMWGCSFTVDELKSEVGNDDKSDSKEESNDDVESKWYVQSDEVQQYFVNRGVAVKSASVEKTYTDERGRTAYVDIVAENDVARLEASYIIKSTKYDDGQWQVTDIEAEENEVYMPLADPKINISYDDSEVVITSTKTEDQGDDIRFVVYYNRVFDGSVARIEESYYKDYFWDKENSNDWITYNLDDECLGGKCELIDISCKYERLSQNQKDIATIGIISKDGKVTIDEFEATLNRNGAWYSKCDIELLDDYVYNDIELSIEEWQSHNARVAKSPCDMDYTYEFKLYNADDKQNVTSILFVTPDELWLVIYSDGQHKICII